MWFIRKNANDPSVVLKQADDVLKIANHASEIIEQLLAAVRHSPDRQLVHLNHIIADAKAIFQGAARERVTIEMNLMAEPDDTIVNRAHLEAALLNLVTNARDAMPAGGVVTIETRNATVRSESIDERDLAPGCYIVLAVRDTGDGMSDEVRRRAFEPFFTTKAAGGRGTGLGLAQVHAFAEHSGGTTRIESALSKGTTVRVYLPRDAGMIETRDHGT